MNVEQMVQLLNEEIYNRFENTKEGKILDSIPPLVSYSSDGYTHGVHFLGILLWDSDNDDRPYSDVDPEEQIPLMEHLRMEMNKFCQVFGKLHLVVIPNHLR